MYDIFVDYTHAFDYVYQNKIIECLMKFEVPDKLITRGDQKVPRLIFFTRLWVHFGTPLFAGWCHRTPSLPGTRDGPSAPSVFCELWSKRVMYLRLVIVSAAEGMALVCGNKHVAGSRVK